MKNYYTKTKKIGKGTYSYIYKAKDKNTGKNVVIKKFRRTGDIVGMPIDFVREFGSLKICHHENIIRIIKVHIFKNNEYCIALPYYRINLMRFYNKFNVTHTMIKSISYKILSGIHYLHSKGVIHRDLKTDNILIDYKLEEGNMLYYNPIIIDSGLSRILEPNNEGEKTPDTVCTIWYRPPEILLKYKKYFYEVDIWSIGCIIMELYNKQPFIRGENDLDQLYKIFKIFGSPNKETWPEIVFSKQYSAIPKFEGKFHTMMEDYPRSLYDLLKGMLTINPNKRLSCCEALNQKYFQMLNDNRFEKCQKIRFENEGEIIGQNENIDENLRKTVINWLIEVSLNYELNDATFFRAVYIFDKYLYKKEIDPNYYQLIAVTCLWFCTKIEEIYPIETEDLINLCGNIITEKDLSKIEKSLVKTLNYDVYYPTIFNYIEDIFDQVKLNELQKEKMLFYLYMSVLNTNYLKYKPKFFVDSIRLIIKRKNPTTEYKACMVEILQNKFYKNLSGIIQKFGDGEWFINKFIDI